MTDLDRTAIAEAGRMSRFVTAFDRAYGAQQAAIARGAIFTVAAQHMPAVRLLMGVTEDNADAVVRGLLRPRTDVR